MPSLARLLSPPRQARVQRLPRPVLKGRPLIVCSTCFKLSRCPPTSPCRPGTVCKLRCRFCSTVLSGVSSGCGRGAASARGRGDGWRRPWFGLRWLAWAGLRGRCGGMRAMARHGRPGRQRLGQRRQQLGHGRPYVRSMQPWRGNMRCSPAAPNPASTRRAQRRSIELAPYVATLAASEREKWGRDFFGKVGTFTLSNCHYGTAMSAVGAGVAGSGLLVLNRLTSCTKRPAAACPRHGTPGEDLGT